MLSQVKEFGRRVSPFGGAESPHPPGRRSSRISLLRNARQAFQTLPFGTSTAAMAFRVSTMHRAHAANSE